MSRTRTIPALLAVLLCLLGPGAAHAAGVTNSADDLRTGWYPDQRALSPQVLSGGNFGQLWSTPVTGQVYAQPLLAGGTLLVGTEANHVYGLDPATGAERWHRQFGAPWNPADLACGDLTPAIGVTATPVVDPATNTAYLTSKTYVSGTSGPARWYLHALDVSSGDERAGFPVVLQGSAQNAPGQQFDPTHHLQRPGLLLLDGVVYAGFGSHCDRAPWQGWIFGVSTAGPITARWVGVTTGDGAGIWQSGSGLMSDGPGTIVVGTGNPGAPPVPTPGHTPPPKLGESIVRLKVQPDGSLRAVDFFAPYDAEKLDTWDADFASGGPVALPDAYFGTSATPRLAVAVGKQGYVYLLDRDDLGGKGQGTNGSDAVVQRVGPYGGVWSRPGVWPGDGGYVYIPTASGGTSAAGSSGFLRVYKYGLSGAGSPTLSLVASSPDPFGFTSSAPVITSDGMKSGSALVWLVKTTGGNGAAAELRAYDPVPVNGEPVLRWKSSDVGSSFTSSKFAMPGVGAGRVYVGTRDGRVLGFGSPVTPVLTGASLEFPRTTAGQTSVRTLSLQATAPVTVRSITSSAGEFRLDAPTLPRNLRAGEKLDVPVTFAPPRSGLFGGTITVATDQGDMSYGESGIGQADGPELTVTPPAVSFGGIAVGGTSSGAVTFTNTGSQNVTITGVNAPAAPFHLDGLPANPTIAPQESLAIGVTFSPTAGGRYAGELELVTDGGNGVVGLTGSAGTPGHLVLSAPAIDFGRVAKGSRADRPITVTNTGQTPVTLTRSKAPSGGAFSLVRDVPEGTMIAGGGTLKATLRYAPTRIGRETGTWSLNGDDTTGPHEIALSGTGTARPVAPPPPPLGSVPPAFDPAVPPIGWWSFGTSTGRRARDASGEGSTGRIAGARWTSAGRRGGALRFHGGGDRVTIPSAPALRLSRAMTVEAWVRPARTSRRAQPVVRGMRGSRTTWALDAGAPAARIGAARARPGGVILHSARWTHLAATWDGAVLRLFVDGERLASRRVGGRLPAGGLRIGGGAFRGLVDEVRLYDRALSAAQIAADMRAPGEPG